MEATRIAVLLTCFNRKNKTIKCLESLFTQTGIDGVELEIYLVDDGCTDGTGDAVRDEFPSVHVLEGDGDLFWNGGMRLAISEAMKEDFEHHLWINDDIELFPDTITSLLQTYHTLKEETGTDVIVCGSMKSAINGFHTYGGVVKGRWWRPLVFQLIQPTDKPQRCDTFNGNTVIIPKSVVDKIGTISPEYEKMQGGDFDYGLRARKLGLHTWIPSGYSGYCEANLITEPLYDASVPISKRLKQLQDPRFMPPARQWLHFVRCHAGFVWPVYWALTMCRVLFPRLYLILKTNSKN